MKNSFILKENIYNSVNPSTGERFKPFLLFAKGSTLAIVNNNGDFEVEKDHILVTDGKRTETIHKQFAE